VLRLRCFKNHICYISHYFHYILIVHSDAIYNNFIDSMEKQTASYYSDWDHLPAMKISKPDY
jgi:hypothetical protein